MVRDKRLTGHLRGQTAEPAAPPGFELNKPWTVWSILGILARSNAFILIQLTSKWKIARKTNLLLNEGLYTSTLKHHELSPMEASHYVCNLVAITQNSWYNLVGHGDCWTTLRT